MIKEVRKRFLFALVLLTVASAFNCSPVLKKEAQQPEEALRQVRFFPPSFHDDMDNESLILALRRNIEYLDRLDPETVFQYGPDKFTIQQVRESQEVFLDLLSKGLDPGQLSSAIRKNFRVYQATGRVGNRRVLFTGYMSPSMREV
jgi:hypothetical protein